MVGVRQMQKLVSLVEQAGAKLLLVGDHTQLQSVGDAGAPFRMLSEKYGVFEMKEIHRQKERWQRELVHDFRWGRTGKALLELADKNLLFVGMDRTDAMAQVILDWKKRAIDEGELDGSMMIAGTNHDVGILNRLAQQQRLAAGQLGETVLAVGDHELRVGDRVAATRNQKAILIDNGMVGTVTAINGHCLRVQFEEYQIDIETTQYKHLDLAYGSTIHRAQGQTASFAFLLVDDVMTNRQSAYVGVSRPKGEIRVYADLLTGGEDIAQLAKIMERDRSKCNAHEHLTEHVTREMME